MRDSSKLKLVFCLIVLFLSFPQVYALDSSDLNEEVHFHYANENWAFISLGLGIILSFYLLKNAN
jgi:hypothetical protein